MAMDHDVDHVFFHHTQIGFGSDRIRRAEKNVLKISRQHGTAPAIGNGGPGALFHQVFIILVHADMGPMHDFNNFSVDISRHDPLLFPEFIAGLRVPVWQKSKFTFGLAPLIASLFRRLRRQFHRYPDPAVSPSTSTVVSTPRYCATSRSLRVSLIL